MSRTKLHHLITLFLAGAALAVNGCGDDSSPASNNATAGMSGRAGAAGSQAGAGRSAGSSGSSGAGAAPMAGGSGDAGDGPLAGGGGEAGASVDAGGNGGTTVGGASGEGGDAVGGEGGNAGASGEAFGGGSGAAGENGSGSGGNGTGGSSGSSGVGGTSGGAGFSGGAAGASGSGGAPLCEPGDAHVCPGETKTFSNGVTVSLEANASGRVGVIVNPSTVTIPSGYSILAGTPSVQLLGTSTTLPGRTTVSITGVTVGAEPIAVLDVERTTVAVGYELLSSTLSFQTWRDGTFVIAFSDGPDSPCEVSTKAGGVFDTTNLSTLQGVTHLTSGLTITGSAPPNLSALSCLVEINGTLSINNAANLTSLTGLGALAIVRGNLDIYANPHLTNADALSAITAIVGRLYVVNNSQLASVDGFRSLTSLGSSLTVDSNPQLLSFRAPALGHLKGGLAFSYNSGSAAQPSSFDLSSVTLIQGGLSVHDSKTWRLGAGLSSLAKLEGNFDVYANAQLDYLRNLEQLQFISGRVYVVNNPALLGVGLDSLDTLGSSLTVDSNAQLLNFSANGLEHLKAGFAFSYNSGSAAQPSSFDVSSVTLIQGGLSIHDNKTWRLGSGLSSLAGLEGNFDVYANAQLDYLRDLEELRTISGRVYVVNNPALLGVDLDSLDTLGSSLTVDSNAQLLSFNADGLEHLKAGFAFSYNSGSAAQPSSFDLSSVTLIQGGLSIHDNKTWRLGSGLSSLAGLEGNFDVYANAQLDYLRDLEELRAISGRVYVVNNPALVGVDLDSLDTLGSSLTVDSNAQLLNFSANGLEHLKAGFAFSYNSGSAAQPSSFDVSSVTLIQGGLSIHDNKTWRLGSGLSLLAQLEGNLDVYANAQLDYLRDLEQLRSISGRVYVVNNPALLGVDLDSLDTLGSSLTVDSNAQLLSFGADSVEHLRAGFAFSYNSGSAAQPSSFDVSSVTLIQGGLSIHDNKTWRLGSGLSSLTQLEGNFDVYSNAQLEHLDEMDDLESISGRLYINNNTTLLTLLGFSSLSDLGGGLTVTSNAALPNCRAIQLRDRLLGEGWDGGSTISGNGSGACP